MLKWIMEAFTKSWHVDWSALPGIPFENPKPVEPPEVVKARRKAAAREYCQMYFSLPKEERPPLKQYVDTFLRIYEGR